MQRRFLALFLLLVVPALSARAAATPREFKLDRDTFSFANDTVFEYGTDETGRFSMRRKEKAPDFSHRCFVLCRAVLQFHRFARFDPAAPRVSDPEYRRLVRRISRIPVWLPPRAKSRRITIPGYRSLHHFSKGNQYMLKQELGGWVPTYLRPGNWRIVLPMPRSGQSALARWLMKQTDGGSQAAVFIVRFPKMNHVVLVFNYRCWPNGDIRFDIYDPNYPNATGALWFRAGESSFEYPERWFFPGGRVNALRAYISPWH